MDNIKEKIENLRETLHNAINNGSSTEIMDVSEEMDRLLLEFIKQSIQKSNENI